MGITAMCRSYVDDGAGEFNVHRQLHYTTVGSGERGSDAVGRMARAPGWHHQVMKQRWGDGRDTNPLA